MNLAAFHWGRRAALDRAAVEALAQARARDARREPQLSQSFEEMVERRVAFLTAYQSGAMRARYRALGREGEGGRSRSARRASAGSPKPSRAICSS